MALNSWEPTDKDRQLKLVLLGDGTTGNTSIATRISKNDFDRAYLQTKGVDFFLRRLELPGDVQVACQVWDIGGQTIGGGMLENYIYGADAVLFVYDITNYASFENLEEWLAIVKSVCQKTGTSLPHLALVANKLDMQHMQTVKKDRHIAFVQERAFSSSHFISAKADDKVNQCFLKVAASVLKIRLTSRDLDESDHVVKAGIVQYDQSSPSILPVRKRKQSTRSSFCTIQ